MARVTVEDCITHIPNRFELVLMAAQRAKQISSGTPLTIERDNDKDGVCSLREIADRTISLDVLKDETINAFCKRQAADIADSKASEEEEMQMDVAQVFEEASCHAKKEDAIDDDSGMSFGEENIDSED